MTMISFTHFDNFDNQSDGFETDFEMDEGDFDSLLLSFSFAKTAEDKPNTNFEFSQTEEVLTQESSGNTEVISEDSNKPNKTIRAFDQAFLPNEEIAFPQAENPNVVELRNVDLSAQKETLQAEALADLESFKESKSLNSAEKEIIKKAVSKDAVFEKVSVPETVKVNSLGNTAELSTAKQPDVSDKPETSQTVKEFIPENNLESKSSNLEKPEFSAKVTEQQIETAKKPATEAEIEEIMVSKFSANEANPATEAKNLSAEKIDLWQFKSPEFQDLKKTADANISETEEVDFGSVRGNDESQNSGKLVNETDVKSLESKPLETKIKTEPESANFQKTQMPKAAAADSNVVSQAETTVEKSGDINLVDVSVSDAKEISQLPEGQFPKTGNEQNVSENQNDAFASIKKEIALKNSVDIINKNPGENEKIDLGEKRITNLSQPMRSETSVENMPLDLGERATNRISQPTPLPIHKQDLDEKAPNNLTNKFTKLIRKVSEALDLSSEKLVELNIDQAETSPENADLKTDVNIEPELDEKTKNSQPKPPILHNDKTQTPDIFINKTEMDAPPREPMKIDLKNTKPIVEKPPVRTPKTQTILQETINPEKAPEIFRAHNVEMEVGNFALKSVENQTEVDLQKYIKQIEVPVLEQVEVPVIEYLTSDEAFKKPEILKLRLHPAELGMVEVRFEKNDAGNIEIHFQAENEIAKQILAEGFDTLHDALQDSGLQVERLEISNSLLSSSGLETGGENPSEHEIIENRDETAEMDDDLENEDDETDRNEPERLVNLRA